MYNKAILIGRLVADPELRTTPSGANVATFRIAVNRSFTSGGERKADFLNVVCWRQQVEFVCHYFSKGKLIGVDGSIQTRDYTDRDGNKRNAFEIVAERVFFVDAKSAGAAAETHPEAVAETPPAAPDPDLTAADDTDLPF